MLQPFLMGKAVELHPLAVFLGVAGGAMIAGIPGALFAIPLLAFLNATLLYVVGRDPSPDLGLDRASREHFAALTRKHPAPAPASGGSGGMKLSVPALPSLRLSPRRQAAAGTGAAAAPLTAPDPAPRAATPETSREDDGGAAEHDAPGPDRGHDA